MLTTALNPNGSQLIQRRLSRAVDPSALYAALTENGSRPDTALFESPQGTTLLMAAAAVRVECRTGEVRLEALSPNGRSLLHRAEAFLAPHIVSRLEGSIELRFEPSRSLDPDERLRAAAPLDAVRQLLRATGLASSADSFAAVAFGVVAFDYATIAEALPENAEDPTGFPDFLFYIPESLIAFAPSSPPRLLCAAFAGQTEAQTRRNVHDATMRLEHLVEACERGGGVATRTIEPGVPIDVEIDLDDEEFARLVVRLKEEIAAGEVYQIVPSRTFRTACSNPYRTFAALRAHEPGSYHFYLAADEFRLFGASPETSVRVFREGGADLIEVRPIAGTRPRGRTPDEDDRLEAELRLCEKEVAEHMMLVDLARNDVSRVSVPGTRHVRRLLSTERYARVMHLVSSVIGQLADDLDPFDALAACLNVGTLTGAPKLRATELLRQTERTRRGPYGGAIGWISATGEMDTSVVIRSAFVAKGMAHVRAGAGIVQDSDPFEEAQETRRKASALLSVLAAVEAEARR